MKILLATISSPLAVVQAPEPFSQNGAEHNPFSTLWGERGRVRGLKSG
jgi:hypothetical protein